jgi:hypothetical protein
MTATSRKNQRIQIRMMAALWFPTGVPTRPAMIRTMKMKRLTKMRAG